MYQTLEWDVYSDLWTKPHTHFYAVKVDGKSMKLESKVIARTHKSEDTAKYKVVYTCTCRT